MDIGRGLTIPEGGDGKIRLSLSDNFDFDFSDKLELSDIVSVNEINVGEENNEG